MAIEVSADAYGNRARASAVADWLELLGWHGKPITFAAASDYLADVNDAELVRLPGETHQQAEDAEGEFIDRIRSVIEQRAAVLGDRYPFAVAEDRLVAQPDPELAPCLYLLLLAVTIAHAYSVPTTSNVEHAFEEIVARCLQGHVRSADLGNMRRSHPTFEDAVRAAGTQVGLSPTPELAGAALAAQDEGVDTICHWDWQDRRVGRWTLIGQATCGQGTSWKRKMAEPKPGIWSTRLGDRVHPLAFLAVPHHVEDRVLYSLVEDGERAVVDRLRLTWGECVLQPHDELLIQEVLAAGVAEP